MDQPLSTSKSSKKEPATFTVWTKTSYFRSSMLSEVRLRKRTWERLEWEKRRGGRWVAHLPYSLPVISLNWQNSLLLLHHQVEIRNSLIYRLNIKIYLFEVVSSFYRPPHSTLGRSSDSKRSRARSEHPEGTFHSRKKSLTAEEASSFTELGAALSSSAGREPTTLADIEDGTF